MSGLKALLVGAGGMGRTWARNLRDCNQTELVAWVEISPEILQSAMEEENIHPAFFGGDLGRALNEVRPDFLVDVTPPEAHCEVTIKSLKAGVPVLGEKPMAPSLEEAKRMVQASEESGKVYMVSQSRRYNTRMAEFRRLIQRIGPLGILNADFFIGPHFGGFREEMPSPLVLDMAIHTFDQARYLSGADPLSVYCEEFNPPWSWYKGDTSATALFHMTGESRFTYRGSWCSEGRHTSWESEWRAVGAQGSATWNGEEDLKADVVSKTDDFFSEFDSVTGDPGTGPTGIKDSLLDFLRALNGDHTPMGECHDNIKSLAMVMGAIESSKSGKRVDIQAMLR